MNTLDFDRSVIRERNEEMVREVRALRLRKRMRESGEAGFYREAWADLERLLLVGGLVRTVCKEEVRR